MRVAIYFTPPPDDALSERAAEWLGRDAFDNRATRGRDPQFDALVSEPARYGFHATLKAPFRLAPDASLDAVTAALATFAADRRPVDLGRLAITRLGRFFALTPVAAPDALGRFEDAVRTAFEPFRAPLSEAEIARRNPDRLTERQRENLHRWGYPHVGPDFRFHMTLTNALDEPEADAIAGKLAAHFEPVLDRAITLDAVTLFIEPEPGAPFEVHARTTLAGALQPAD